MDLFKVKKQQLAAGSSDGSPLYTVLSGIIGAQRQLLHATKNQGEAWANVCSTSPNNGDQVEHETQGTTTTKTTTTTTMTAMMATIEAAVGTNQQFYRPWQRNEIHSKKILSRELK